MFDVYRDKTVLVTGHTGFKGSWLCLWLERLGANVVGYALNPSTRPNHFDLLKLGMVSIIGDIRDREKLTRVFETHLPEIVFHLAAQPLVRYGYANPVDTLEINIMGTVNVLELSRKIKSVGAIVNVTSDKCYENKEWLGSYRETDPVGGYDPYSASKGCAEIVTAAYRRSFFNPGGFGANHNTLVASARAGNVIGGGDWSEDRLIPDIVRAAIGSGKVSIRNPKSVRPWQHVLEPLAGYLMLGERLIQGKVEFADAWNFGPGEESHAKVEDIVNGAKKRWDRVEFEINSDNTLHEAGILKLDCSKALVSLGWKHIWGLDQALDATMNWYRQYYANGATRSREDLDTYTSLMEDKT
ncbi:MAG: CDP-glucose 4,6-dehydratase [Nitrospiraceae bacterium]|nr:CDP-glucose 4,6-dehydratase [Nitrospiraceae bacterium]